MLNTFGQTDVEQSTLELIFDQLEELVVTIFEEIRERPGVAAAILAAVVGAVVGSMLATRARRSHAVQPARLPRRAHAVSDAADLAVLGFKLLQNPLVRGYIVSAMQGQLKKRFVR
jgi:tetrahydromethanopterin S-methyltransferase subunit C